MPMTAAERQARYRARRKLAAEEFSATQSSINETQTQIRRIQQEIKQKKQVVVQRKAVDRKVITSPKMQIKHVAHIADLPGINEIPEILRVPKIEIFEDPVSVLVRCITPPVSVQQIERKPSQTVGLNIPEPKRRTKVLTVKAVGRPVREKDRIYARNTRRNAKERLQALPPEIQKILIDENKRKQRERSQKYRMRKRGILKEDYTPFESKEEYEEIMDRVRFSLPDNVQQKRTILKLLLKEMSVDEKGMQNTEESSGAREDEESFESFDQTKFLEVILNSPDNPPIKQEPEEMIPDFTFEDS